MSEKLVRVRLWTNSYFWDTVFLQDLLTSSFSVILWCSSSFCIGAGSFFVGVFDRTCSSNVLELNFKRVLLNMPGYLWMSEETCPPPFMVQFLCWDTAILSAHLTSSFPVVHWCSSSFWIWAWLFFTLFLPSLSLHCFEDATRSVLLNIPGEL